MRTPLPGVLALALLAAGCGRVAAEDREGDVLFVTIDTLRADFVSAYGAPLDSTPHFDALARQGVLLENHHAVTSLTAPSHLSMFTGMLPAEHGLRRNGPRIAEGLPYLPETLARAGWRTGGFLGANIMKGKAGFARGFAVFDEEFDEHERYKQNQFRRRGEHVVSRAIEFLEDADERPTFLWVHLYDVHGPYEPAEEFLRGEDEAAAAFSARLEPSGLYDEAAQLDMRRRYEGEVRYADAQLGRLLAAWDSRERGRRGLVVVTSDHGEGLGEHDYDGHGFHVYQEQLLVPLTLRLRGRLPEGRRVAAPTTAVDLTRTLAELLGVDMQPFGGRSLVPLLTGAEATGRAALLAERRQWPENDIERRGDIADLIAFRAGAPGAHYGDQVVLLRAPWKFIWNAEGPHELYHLERDPAELDNRAGDQTELAASLLAEVEAWRSSIQAREGDGEVSEETLRMLQSLGY
jgi:arylsulfatase